MTRPGLLTVVLIGLSPIALFGGAWLVPSDRGGLAGSVALITATAPILIAVAVQVPSAPVSVRPLLGASVAAYAVAFTLPTTIGFEMMTGYVVFWAAMGIVPWVWAANPLYLLALFAARHRAWLVATLLMVVAIVLALGVRSMVDSAYLFAGYYVWLAAFAVGAAASLYGLLTD